MFPFFCDHCQKWKGAATYANHYGHWCRECVDKDGKLLGMGYNEYYWSAHMEFIYFFPNSRIRDIPKLIGRYCIRRLKCMKEGVI